MRQIPKELPRAKVHPAPLTDGPVTETGHGGLGRLAVPKGLLRDPWSPNLGLDAMEAIDRQDETEPATREEIQEILSQVLDPEAARIHPTWFLPEEPEHLPESLLEFLPRDVADRVRLLAGPTLVQSDALSADMALELARALWGHLTPAKPRSRLGQSLWALDHERLEAVLETAGIELAGSLLALVPERSAAALCANLPPIQARSLWLARKTPAFPTTASWIRALAPSLAGGASMALIRHFSWTVLTSALAPFPGDRDRVRKRLYRTWFPATAPGESGSGDPKALPDHERAAERLELILAQVQGLDEDTGKSDTGDLVPLDE